MVAPRFTGLVVSGQLEVAGCGFLASRVCPIPRHLPADRRCPLRLRFCQGSQADCRRHRFQTCRQAWRSMERERHYFDATCSGTIAPCFCC